MADRQTLAASPAILTRLFGLDERIAVVVGGAGRIGGPLCHALSAAGATVCILDVNQDAADQLAAKIAKDTGRRVLVQSADATREDQLRGSLADITQQCGTPDILIHAAQFRGGAFYSSDVAGYPREAWDRVIETNLTSVHLACQVFGGAMAAASGGKIAVLGSTYGLVSPDPRIYGHSGVNSPVSYAAAKSALVGMVRYLAVHWRERNVRVNCLAPGGVFDEQSPEFVENYCRRTPLGRMARAEDYQGAVLFMVSPASDYMTGAVVTVDGGWTAW